MIRIHDETHKPIPNTVTDIVNAFDAIGVESYIVPVHYAGVRKTGYTVYVGRTEKEDSTPLFALGFTREGVLVDYDNDSGAIYKEYASPKPEKKGKTP